MRLSELRTSRGLTQDRVASAIGLPVKTYRNYERGERQTPTDVLFKLADFYDVSLDYLMGHDVSESDADKAQLSAFYDMLDCDGRSLLLSLARAIVKSGEYLSI